MSAIDSVPRGHVLLMVHTVSVACSAVALLADIINGFPSISCTRIPVPGGGQACASFGALVPFVASIMLGVAVPFVASHTWWRALLWILRLTPVAAILAAATAEIITLHALNAPALFAPAVVSFCTMLNLPPSVHFLELVVSGALFSVSTAMFAVRLRRSATETLCRVGVTVLTWLACIVVSMRYKYKESWTSNKVTAREGPSSGTAEHEDDASATTTEWWYVLPRTHGLSLCAVFLSILVCATPLGGSLLPAAWLWCLANRSVTLLAILAPMVPIVRAASRHATDNLGGAGWGTLVHTTTLPVVCWHVDIGIACGSAIAFGFTRTVLLDPLLTIARIPVFAGFGVVLAAKARRWWQRRRLLRQQFRYPPTLLRHGGASWFVPEVDYFQAAHCLKALVVRGLLSGHTKDEAPGFFAADRAYAKTSPWDYSLLVSLLLFTVTVVHVRLDSSLAEVLVQALFSFLHFYLAVGVLVSTNVFAAVAAVHAAAIAVIVWTKRTGVSKRQQRNDMLREISVWAVVSHLP